MPGRTPAAAREAFLAPLRRCLSCITDAQFYVPHARLAEAGAAIGPCEPGDAIATPAFDLHPPVRHVIHTVGPVWEGGGYDEAEILASCYRRSLPVADALGARSIAFPAIATGVYGFPPQQAAKIAVETIRSTVTAVEHVRLVAFDEPARDLLEAALRA